MNSIPIPRPKATKKKPQGLCLDKGYDYDSVRDLVKEFGYTAHIKSRGEEAQAIKRQADDCQRIITPLFAAINFAAILLLAALPWSPKYDGVRLFLPLFPFVALLAGAGFQRLWQRYCIETIW